MALIDQDRFKYLLDFEKYARFIAGTFKIEVIFDSVEAKTDGNVIYLPNIATMSAREVDMLYAILLHEVGHIKYSTFDREYFEQLKTQAHAFLANAIEDARIENLLIGEFDGARDMFDKLYCDFTNDKALMKKVFKHDDKKPSLFTALGFYVHNVLVDCDTPELEVIVGPRNAGQIMNFWNDYNVDDVLRRHRLATPNDVLKITNEIYDLFTKMVEDKSDKLSYKKVEDQKDATNDILDMLAKEAEKAEAQIAKLREKVRDLDAQIADYDAKHPELEELERTEAEYKEKAEDARTKFKSARKADKAGYQADRNIQRAESLNKRLDALQAELQGLQETLDRGTSEKTGKPLSQQRLEALQARIDKKNDSIKNTNDRIAVLDAEAQDLVQEREQLQGAIGAATTDDLNKLVDEVYGKLNDVHGQLTKINSGKSNLIADRQKIKNQMSGIRDGISKQVSKMVLDAVKAGLLPEGTLPDLNYVEDWPEAAAAQEQFDEFASDRLGGLVRNGMGAGLFGTNIRDIVIYIDATKADVDAIDVSKLFKEKLQVSRFDDLNDFERDFNDREDTGEVGNIRIGRELIPVTTQYDSVRRETSSTAMPEVAKLLAKNGSFYRDLERIFQKKFKFAKKDYWRGGKEEGDLDARSLWKIPTGQGDDFYERNERKPINKTIASILVDISGSQNKEDTDYGKRIQELVLGLSTALDKVYIKHEILGYHAPVCSAMSDMKAAASYGRKSNRLETVVYKEMSQKDKSGIMNILPQLTDNSDGESMRVALKRLKKENAKSRIMFVISDGKPMLSNVDMDLLDSDFASAIDQARRDKVQVVGLGYFDQLRYFLGERFCNAGNERGIIEFFDRTNFGV